MIQPISSNINFKGKVSIGENLYEKTQIARNISLLPKSMQAETVSGLNSLKTELELNTPKDFLGYINVKFINGSDNSIQNASFSTDVYNYRDNGDVHLVTSVGGSIIDESGKSKMGRYFKVAAGDVKQASLNKSYWTDKETNKILDRLA